MEVVLTSVALGGRTYGMILVYVVMLKQGVQRLHQPEADEECCEHTCRQAGRYGVTQAEHRDKYTGNLIKDAG